MDGADKEDIIYAISTVEQAAGSIDASLGELTNQIGITNIHLGGSSGILDGLHQLNKKLAAIKWILSALLLATVFILLKI